MRVAVVENTEVSLLGQLGVALREADAEIQTFRAWAGEALPDGSYHDALVVLGGEQNARADESHPYLPGLVRLMRRMGQADKAVLGISLGSQILARAWGAQNLPGTAPEFGWHRVTPTEAGLTDPVLSVIGGPFLTFQWHQDTFTLPKGATHLAAAPGAAQQCFRVGRASYGMQFHFEADREVVSAWNAEFPRTIERISPGWLAAYPARASADGPEADAAGLAIARAWVSLI